MFFLMLWPTIGWIIWFSLTRELKWWCDPFSGKKSAGSIIFGLVIGLWVGGILGPLAWLPKTLSR
jgi:hypothetical protein